MLKPKEFADVPIEDLIEGLLRHPDFYGIVIRADWNPVDPFTPPSEKLYVQRSGPFLEKRAISDLLYVAIEKLKEKSRP